MRLLTGGYIAATECGDIECTVQGSGPPVLLAHGAGGGYDQGLLMSEFYVGNHYHFILSMFGVSGEVQKRTTARSRQLFSDFLNSMHPISLRKDGIYHDMATMAVLPGDVFGLEQITVPTLVIYAVDDGLQPYGHGVNMATRVPDAAFVSYEWGGHLLMLQIDDVREKVTAFLRLHGPK